MRASTKLKLAARSIHYFRQRYLYNYLCQKNCGPFTRSIALTSDGRAPAARVRGHLSYRLFGRPDRQRDAFTGLELARSLASIADRLPPPLPLDVRIRPRPSDL